MTVMEKRLENGAKLQPSADSLARARAFVAFSAQDIRVDWFRLILQIQAEGYNLRAISYFTGISKSSLINYKNEGAQPSYHVGVCLLQFWSETTGRDTAEAPTISLYSFKA